MASSFLEIKSTAGEPVVAGRLQLIPIAQSVRLGPPARPSGLVWNRPVAVVAQTPDGVQQVLQIEDVTRRVQIALLGAGMLASLLAWLVLRRRAAPAP